MENKTKKIVSSVLQDGSIVELVYDAPTKTTRFVVFKNGEISYLDQLELENEILKPLPGDNHLIEKGVVLFPSIVQEYGSTQELVNEISVFVHKYLDISPRFEKIAAYYVLSTWVFDKFNELAYLRFLGDYGSGKSRALQVVGSMCYKPMFVAGATTTSPIFRIIDFFRGTLTIDEADYRFSDTTTEIVKILNSGYQRGTPVLRTEGNKTYEVRSYDVFCPKIVATRKKFSDIALESRFLIETMDKKELRDDIPLNLPPPFQEETLRLRNKLLKWRFDNFHKITLRPHKIDKSIEPRLNQIIAPMLSIVGESEAQNMIKDLIKEHDIELSADRGMSIEADLFAAFVTCIGIGYDEPTVKQISDTFNAGQGQRDGLSPRRAGSMLRTQLKLKLRRTGEGYVISSLENKFQIEFLKKKYKFGYEDSESVNDVNEVSDEKEEDKQIELESDKGEINEKKMF